MHYRTFVVLDPGPLDDPTERVAKALASSGGSDWINFEIGGNWKRELKKLGDGGRYDWLKLGEIDWASMVDEYLLEYELDKMDTEKALAWLEEQGKEIPKYEPEAHPNLDEREYFRTKWLKAPVVEQVMNHCPCDLSFFYLDEKTLGETYQLGPYSEWVWVDGKWSSVPKDFKVPLGKAAVESWLRSRKGVRELLSRMSPEKILVVVDIHRA